MYLIAEIGFNHNGNLELAEKMIREAADAGADAVKFQTFKADDIALPSSPHYDLIKKGELSLNDHEALFKTAAAAHVDFLSTPFSKAGIDLLQQTGVPAFKIASMDCTNHPLLKLIAETGKPLYISTGMAGLSELADTLDFLKKHNCTDITLLHCISNYPAKAEELNLAVIPYLKSLFNVRVGYSDHYPGVEACIAAAMLGADVIETHFTLDKTIPGGDHSHSADPSDLKHLKQTLDLYKTMQGSRETIFNRPDRSCAKEYRRGVYAAVDLNAGEVINEENLFCTRPESDFSPNDIEHLKGRPLARSIPACHPVTRESLA